MYRIPEYNQNDLSIQHRNTGDHKLNTVLTYVFPFVSLYYYTHVNLSYITTFYSIIIHKMFQTNPSFHVKQHTTEKVQFLFFRRFLLELTKFSFCKEDYILGNNSIKFCDFIDFFYFFKSSDVWQLVWQLVYTSLTLIITPSKRYSTIKKFPNFFYFLCLYQQP